MSRPYICPTCGTGAASSLDLVRHMLEEAGASGVTTGQFLQAGCGSRFGARVDDLRHKLGFDIGSERLGPGSHRYWIERYPSSAGSSGIDLMCSRGHIYQGRVSYCRSGFPLAATAGPDCPTCGHPPICVEAPIQPARADVVAAAHDLREAA